MTFAAVVDDAVLCVNWLHMTKHSTFPFHTLFTTETLEIVLTKTKKKPSINLGSRIPMDIFAWETTEWHLDLNKDFWRFSPHFTPVAGNFGALFIKFYADVCSLGMGFRAGISALVTTTTTHKAIHHFLSQSPRPLSLSLSLSQIPCVQSSLRT